MPLVRDLVVHESEFSISRNVAPRGRMLQLTTGSIFLGRMVEIVLKFCEMIDGKFLRRSCGRAGEGRTLPRGREIKADEADSTSD